MKEIKNELLEEFMWRNGISQKRLGEVLGGLNQPQVSGLMNVELTEEQQKEFIKKLEEAING